MFNHRARHRQGRLKVDVQQSVTQMPSACADSDDIVLGVVEACSGRDARYLRRGRSPTLFPAYDLNAEDF